MNTLREILATMKLDFMMWQTKEIKDARFSHYLQNNFLKLEQAIADYEASKWVSVDERLPDLGVKVITDSGNSQYNIASFYADQNRWVNVSGHTLSHVIKWSKIL